MASASTKINKKIRESRKWLERDQFHAQVQSYVDKAIKDNSLAGFACLEEWLSSLGLYHGTRGLIGLVDQNPQGWSEICGAIECYWWSVRLEIKTYYSWLITLRRGRQTSMLRRLRRAVNLLSFFVATENVPRQNQLWSVLEQVIQDNDVNIQAWWRERIFEPCFVSLYGRRWGKLAFPGIGQWDFGVYQPVLDAWNDDRALSVALKNACDYHLGKMENTRYRDAEFDRPPFDLIPVEIHAINQLRVGMGLGAVAVVHPLMQIVSKFEQAPIAEGLSDTLYRVRLKYDDFFRE